MGKRCGSKNIKQAHKVMVCFVFVYTILLSLFGDSAFALTKEEYEEQYNPKIEITSDTVIWETGRYYVVKDTYIDENVQVQGSAQLILGDNVTLKVGDGITIGRNQNLTISGKNGVLIAEGSSADQAGIGVNAGKLTIQEGTIIARGASNAPGIGCQPEGQGSLTFNGGKVYSYGGTNAEGIRGGNTQLTFSGGFVYAKGQGEQPGIQAVYIKQPESDSIVFAESGNDDSLAISGTISQHLGLLFQNKVGEIGYGNTYTLEQDLTIPEDYTLILRFNDHFTVSSDATFINHGTITYEYDKIDEFNTNGPKLQGNGQLINYGTIDDKIEYNKDWIISPKLQFKEEVVTTYINQPVSLEIEAFPQKSETQFVWASSDPSVATVTDGTVYPRSAGKTEITVSDGNLTACCQVEVKEIPVASVKLTASSLNLYLGETGTLSAEVLPKEATGYTVTWEVDNPNIVSVQNGTVTAQSVGTAIVTASVGNISDSCEVVVSEAVVPVESIKLNMSSCKLEVGQTAQLEAAVYPENATNRQVTWESKNPMVASVKDGLVTAHTEGVTEIYASVGEIIVCCTVQTSEKEQEPSTPPEKAPDEPAPPASDPAGTRPGASAGPPYEWIYKEPDYHYPASTPYTGWKTTGSGRYYYENGARVNGRRTVGGKTYFFSGGKPETGWIERPEGWYYAGGDGALRVGWLKAGNAWYYLDPGSGQMAGDGLLEVNGETYYFYDWGGMANDWWYEADDGWYFFDGSGAMRRGGWLQWKGQWYYLTGSGRMAADTVTPDGYRVDGNGAWVA